MEQKKQKEFIRLRIKLADDKLRLAKKLLTDKEYRDAISRAYYAMYHIAKAILFLKGKDPYTHRGVNIFFNKIFTKTKIIDKKYSYMLARAQEKREDSDYDIIIEPTQKEAQETVKNAEEFIKKCKEIIIKQNNK